MRSQIVPVFYCRTFRSEALGDFLRLFLCKSWVKRYGNRTGNFPFSEAAGKKTPQVSVHSHTVLPPWRAGHGNPSIRCYDERSATIENTIRFLNRRFPENENMAGDIWNIDYRCRKLSGSVWQRRPKHARPDRVVSLLGFTSEMLHAEAIGHFCTKKTSRRTVFSFSEKCQIVLLGYSSGYDSESESPEKFRLFGKRR